jgi:hypothetical protein
MAQVSRERSGISVMRGSVVGAVQHIQQLTRGASSEVRFQLDGISVVWRGQTMLAAMDGEDVIVAGYFKGSEYWVLAWWNVSRRTGGNQDRVMFWPGFAFVCAGFAFLGALISLGKVGLNEGTFLVGLLLAMGLTFMRSGFVVGEAVRGVRRARDEPC